MMRCKRLSLLCAILFANTVPVLAQWQWTGGPRLTDYNALGSSGDRVFMTSYISGGYISVSSDQGDSWSMSSNNLGGGSHGFCTWMIGTDTLIFATSRSNSIEICKSTNLGLDWTPSDSGLFQAEVNSIVFSRGSGSSAKGVLVAGYSSAGIYVSTDAGASWYASDSGLTTLSVNTVAASDSTLFAGTTGQGIFRSLDNGSTWAPVNSGLADSTVSILTSMQGQVFAACGKMLYRSTDDGSSWDPASPSPLPSAITSLALIPAPGVGRGVAAFADGDSGIYRLDASDTIWTRVGPPEEGDWSNKSNFVSSGATLFYMSRGKGIYRSTDRGETWERIPTVSGTELFKGIDVEGTGRPEIYGTRGRELAVSTNQARSWKSLFINDDLGNVTCLAVTKKSGVPSAVKMTVGCDNDYSLGGSIYRSVDGGKTWTRLRTFPNRICLAVADLDSVLYATALSKMFAPSSGDTAVFRSVDEGATWEQANWGVVSDSGVTDLAVIPSRSGQRLLFAGNYRHLYRSTDGGRSWSDCSSGLTGTGRKMLRQLNGDIYLANNGAVYSTYDDQGNITITYDSAGVFRSTDEGMTWQDVTGDLHVTFIRGFDVATPTQYPSHVFLAVRSDDSVFTSTEGGGRWTNLTSNLSMMKLSPRASLAADADNIYVGCYGLYKRPWTDATITAVDISMAEVPSSSSLSQNYPNPFNPVTTIGFRVAGFGSQNPGSITRDPEPGTRAVRLTVYDMLGREVAVLVDEKKEPGSYEVKFDGSRLSSGVYFYRMHASDPSLRSGQSFVQTRKLLLLK